MIAPHTWIFQRHATFLPNLAGLRRLLGMKFSGNSACRWKIQVSDWQVVLKFRLLGGKTVVCHSAISGACPSKQCADTISLELMTCMLAKTI